MSIESESAEQMVNMTLKVGEEAINVGTRLAGASVKTAGAILYGIFRAVRNHKDVSAGEKKLNKLYQECNGDIAIFTLKDEDLKAWAKHAKDYDLQYSLINDQVANDGVFDIAVKGSDAARVNRIIERFGLGLIGKADFKPNTTEPINEQSPKEVTLDDCIQEMDAGEIDGYMVACSKSNPDSYIEAVSSLKQHEDRTYICTEYTIFNNGVKQSCDEFKHNRFTHYSDRSGNNSSTDGEAHWENLQKEIREKSGCSDDMILFYSAEAFRQYKAERNKSIEQEQKDIPLAGSTATEIDQVLDNVQSGKEQNTPFAQRAENAAPLSERSSVLQQGTQVKETITLYKKKPSVRNKIRNLEAEVKAQELARAAERSSELAARGSEAIVNRVTPESR